jgi:ribosome recycling factor
MLTLKEAQKHMDETLEALRREFATVRTGKATPALLDTVRVEAYGGLLPLNQVASVSTPEASLLVVQPYDASLVRAIETGILKADLGLNPANDGRIIRIPIPPLNEDRRKEFVRLLHKMAEEGRVSLRHSRKEANDRVKARVKAGDISDDDGHREMQEIQKLTDAHSEKIDALLAVKEKEVLSV